MNLPEKIKVKVKKCSHDKYLIELPEYDLHSQADRQENIEELVNDLIYCYFDVPENLQNKLYYRPIKKELNWKEIAPFVMFSTPDVFRKYVN